MNKVEEFLAAQNFNPLEELMAVAPLSHQFLLEYRPWLEWFAITNNPHIPWTAELIKSFSLHWFWEELLRNPGLPRNDELDQLFEAIGLGDAFRATAPSSPINPPEFTAEEAEEALRKRLPHPDSWISWLVSAHFYELREQCEVSLENPPGQFADFETGEVLFEGTLALKIRFIRGAGALPGCPFGEVMEFTEAEELLGIRRALLCSERFKAVAEQFSIAPHAWIPCTTNGHDAWMLYFPDKGRGAIENMVDFGKTTFRGVKVEMSDSEDSETLLRAFEKGELQSLAEVDAVKYELEARRQDPDELVIVVPDAYHFREGLDLLWLQHRLVVSRAFADAMHLAGIDKSVGFYMSRAVSPPVKIPPGTTEMVKARQSQALDNVRQRFAHLSFRPPSPEMVDRICKRMEKKIRHRRLNDKMKRLRPHRNGLAELRAGADQPDFSEQMASLETQLGFRFPQVFREYINWLQGINMQATSLPELPESRLMFEFPNAEGPVVQLFDLQTELPGQTRKLRETTGDESLVFFGRVLQKGKHEIGSIAFGTETQELFLWLTSKSKLLPFKTHGWSDLFGEPAVLHELLKVENQRDVIFPHWWRMAAAHRKLRKRIGQFELWPANEVCHLADIQSYESDFPETFKAICLAQADDSNQDDFLAFLLREDDDFALREEVYGVSDYGSYLTAAYTMQELIVKG